MSDKFLWVISSRQKQYKEGRQARCAHTFSDTPQTYAHNTYTKHASLSTKRGCQVFTDADAHTRSNILSFKHTSFLFLLQVCTCSLQLSLSLTLFLSFSSNQSFTLIHIHPPLTKFSLLYWLVLQLKRNNMCEESYNKVTQLNKMQY